MQRANCILRFKRQCLRICRIVNQSYGNICEYEFFNLKIHLHFFVNMLYFLQLGKSRKGGEILLMPIAACLSVSFCDAKESSLLPKFASEQVKIAPKRNFVSFTNTLLVFSLCGLNATRLKHITNTEYRNEMLPNYNRQNNHRNRLHVYFSSAYLIRVIKSQI